MAHVSLHLRLPPHQATAVEQIAERETQRTGRKMFQADVIRAALTRYLNEKQERGR